jgi:hypothetical protein
LAIAPFFFVQIRLSPCDELLLQLRLYGFGFVEQIIAAETNERALYICIGLARSPASSCCLLQIMLHQWLVEYHMLFEIYQ